MRTTRKLSEETKRKISQAIKEQHRRKGDFEKQKTAQKQSESMKKYWKTVPKAPIKS